MCLLSFTTKWSVFSILQDSCFLLKSGSLRGVALRVKGVHFVLSISKLDFCIVSLSTHNMHTAALWRVTHKIATSQLSPHFAWGASSFWFHLVCVYPVISTPTRPHLNATKTNPRVGRPGGREPTNTKDFIFVTCRKL